MGRKIINSFYDWCIENSHQDYLDLWDYDLNDVDPKDIGSTTSKKYFFKCPRGIHRSELYIIGKITRKDTPRDIDCRRCHSFGQWCIDSGNLDLLKRWNCELNKTSPFDVNKYSGKKYYFNCPKNDPNHLPEEKIISNVVQQEGSRQCIGCISFAQWCIDNIDKDFIDKYWSEKNTVNPFTIVPTHTKKVWIKCISKNYHDDYDIMPYNFIAGKRCPYCSSKRVNHYDSLGYNFPAIIDYWSDKNEDSPFDYFPQSNKVKWFFCNKHGHIQRKISDVIKGECTCPECNAESNLSKLAKKVIDYLSPNYNLLHEESCELVTINPRTGYRLLYDNQVVDLNLYIEVHGKQHYEITLYTKLSASANNKTPEEELEYQKWKDAYKKNDVLSHGYYYLEIPYWSDDENQSYKRLIDNKIDEILNNSNNNISTVTTAGGNEQSLS